MLWKKLGEAEPPRSQLSRDMVGSENLGVQGLDGCPGVLAAPLDTALSAGPLAGRLFWELGALQVDGVCRDLRGRPSGELKVNTPRLASLAKWQVLLS